MRDPLLNRPLRCDTIFSPKGDYTMAENGAHLPPNYAEDRFDLDEHKKTAATRVRAFLRHRRVRRKVSLYKVLIMIFAFVIMFCLYHMINKLILHYDYVRYGGASARLFRVEVDVHVAGALQRLHHLSV